MAPVTVEPEEFDFVEFDAGRIAELTAEMAGAAGLEVDLDVHVEVDQASPFGFIETRLDGNAVTIHAESAAFEDARHPRHLSEEATRQVLGRLLFRLADRLDPQFGDPPPDSELTYQQQTVWDAYALGRCERAGYEMHQRRRRYHFRLRHGFTDVADRVFDRLWAADSLTWSDLEAACAETAAARPEGEDRPTRPPRAKARAAR